MSSSNEMKNESDVKHHEYPSIYTFQRDGLLTNSTWPSKVPIEIENVRPLLRQMKSFIPSENAEQDKENEDERMAIGYYTERFDDSRTFKHEDTVIF